MTISSIYFFNNDHKTLISLVRRFSSTWLHYCIMYHVVMGWLITASEISLDWIVILLNIKTLLRCENQTRTWKYMTLNEFSEIEGSQIELLTIERVCLQLSPLPNLQLRKSILNGSLWIKKHEKKSAVANRNKVNSNDVNMKKIHIVLEIIIMKIV